MQDKFKLSDGTIISDGTLISNKFNEFFTNIGPNLEKTWSKCVSSSFHGSSISE